MRLGSLSQATQSSRVHLIYIQFTMCGLGHMAYGICLYWLAQLEDAYLRANIIPYPGHLLLISAVTYTDHLYICCVDRG